MKCKNCKKELKKDWKYCPYCGEQINLFRVKFPKFFSHENEIEKEMEEMFEALGFPGIKISFRTQSGPINQKVVKKEFKPKKIKQIQRKVDSVEEPNVKINYLPSEIHIEVLLPGVSSIKDIVIRRFEESLEIRAYAGNKMYFKVIPVNKESRILQESYRNKILKLVLSK